MRAITVALESTTSHGLPRVVTNKPFFVRITWLLLYLFMLALFLKGFVDLVIKLQSRQVTASLEANSQKFQFPDIYACFENPISASYSANIAKSETDRINKIINSTMRRVFDDARALGYSEVTSETIAKSVGYIYPQSLPYDLLINSLAHRTEQAVIESYAIYKADNGLPGDEIIASNSFYNPTFLRCIKWSINATFQDVMLRSRQYSGLFVTLLIDTEFSDKMTSSSYSSSVLQLYTMSTPIPLSNWPMSVADFKAADRRAGVRVFLAPPGEYPSDFVTSFSLGPGKHHTVDISMAQQQYKDGQFDCMSETPNVQFVNPYDQTPYSHAYSYSYCYYYEYHKQYQSISNSSGYPSPMPWALPRMNYGINISNMYGFNVLADDPLDVTQKLGRIEKHAQVVCEPKRPCSTLDYSVSISSADWPTQSSLATFVGSSIKQACTSAKDKNLSVPALDFLVTGNASSVASYVRSNMLKVHFKPHKVDCDRVTLSIEYGVTNFISDIGGIMGIYLGMSLLTMFELFELLWDLYFENGRRQKSQKVSRVSSVSAVSAFK